MYNPRGGSLAALWVRRMMAGACRISVEIPKKSYDNIRRRLKSSEQKTSRVLSRYLLTFFAILEGGEENLHRTFSRAEARRLATVLSVIRRADEISWEELCVFTGPRLSALVGLYAPNETLIVSKLATLGALEILALIEYARLIELPERFEQQTSRFRL